MMNYNFVWNELKEEIKYEQVLTKMRSFWREFTEGFFTITPSYSHYCEVLRYLQKDLPTGWTVTLDFDCTISATFFIKEKQATIKLQKDNFGKEYVNFSFK
jgi:hypothetical protein